MSNGMEVDPQEIEVQIKDKYEEISNQEFKSKQWYVNQEYWFNDSKETQYNEERGIKW